MKVDNKTLNPGSPMGFTSNFRVLLFLTLGDL